MLILQPVDSLGVGKRIQVCIYSCKALNTALVLCERMNNYVTSKLTMGVCVFSPSEMHQLTPLCYSRMSPIACFLQLVKPEGSKWILGYVLRHAVRVQGLETSGLTRLWAKVCNVGWNLFLLSLCLNEPVWTTVFLGQNKSTEVKTKLMFLKCPETWAFPTFPVCSKHSYSPCHHWRSWVSYGECTLPRTMSLIHAS